MNLTLIYPVFTLLIVALFTTWLISRKAGIHPVEMQYKSIDGLRGYLAFFVFIHHAFIWRGFIQWGVWDTPRWHAYNHFGQSSVMLFFMITGFLFFGKLIDGREKPVAWLHFFVSRIMRLAPLYLLAVFFVCLLIGFRYGFGLKEPVTTVLVEILQWAGFTVFGVPGINRSPDAGFMMAGVTWSLVYEWLFYCSLPLLSFFFFRFRTSLIALLVSAALAWLIWVNNTLPLIHLYAFGSGLLAAYLVRSPMIRIMLGKTVFSFLALAALVSSVYFFKEAYSPVPFLLNTVFFCIVAGGNSLFGFLETNLSRLFGQLSYGIYLLQGLFLYILFKSLIGTEVLKEFSDDVYWLMMTGMTAVFITIVYAAHLYIELPGIRMTSRISKRLYRLFRISPAGDK